MSCGRPHVTPCTTVLSLVHAYSDGETTEIQALEIVQHLHECPPCDEHYGVVRTVKVLIQRSCSAPAPAGLRAQILTRLREVSVSYRPEGADE